MDKLKIGIIEDDLLIAESMVVMLQQIGYNPTKPVRNYERAVAMLKTESPDLLLIDIQLEGDLDGIDLARMVNKDFGLPFIFVTANSDRSTVERAKEVKPYAYLVKPFNENDLYSSIEIAFSAFHQTKKDSTQEEAITFLKDVIFVKENQIFHKVAINDILYVESDNVYLTIHTAKKNYVVRAKLEDFISNFAMGDLFRIHRSYAINVKHLETINEITVKVAGKEVPMNKVYRQELFQRINTLK